MDFTRRNGSSGREILVRLRLGRSAHLDAGGAGGVHGTNRVGANAIADCLSFGRVAGHEAAGFTR